MRKWEKYIAQSWQHSQTPKFKRSRTLCERSPPKFSAPKICKVTVRHFFLHTNHMHIEMHYFNRLPHKTMWMSLVSFCRGVARKVFGGGCKEKSRGSSVLSTKIFQFKVAQPSFFNSFHLYLKNSIQFSAHNYLNKQKPNKNIFLPCKCIQPDFLNTL